MNQTDAQLLEGLAQNREDALRAIQELAFPAILRLIETNHGLRQDAEDLFQEALIVVYLRYKEGNLTLTCRLSTFIYAICRNMWMERVRREARQVQLDESQMEIVDLTPSTLEAMEETEKNLIMTRSLAQLGEDCQRLLKLFSAGLSMRDIARELNYSSERYARKRKFSCKEALLELVKKDRRYQELTDKKEMEE